MQLIAPMHQQSWDRLTGMTGQIPRLLVHGCNQLHFLYPINYD